MRPCKPFLSLYCTACESCHRRLILTIFKLQERHKFSKGFKWCRNWLVFFKSSLVFARYWGSASWGLLLRYGFKTRVDPPKSYSYADVIQLCLSRIRFYSHVFGKCVRYLIRRREIWPLGVSWREIEFFNPQVWNRFKCDFCSVNFSWGEFRSFVREDERLWKNDGSKNLKNYIKILVYRPSSKSSLFSGKMQINLSGVFSTTL